MHSRAVIKDKFKTLLLNNTAAADRVYVSRRVPLPEEEDGVMKLPAICIYSPKEKSEMIDNLNNKRTADIIVECTVAAKADGTLDAAIDQIAAQVEDVLVEEPYLQDTVNGVDLVLTEELESDEGDTRIGGVRLTYEVVYFAEKRASVPATGSELEGANVQYNGGAFSDDVPLPQPEPEPKP